MYEYNDGTGEANVLQNQFTAYLVTAIKNSRTQYLRRKQRQQENEFSLVAIEYLTEFQYEQDMFCSMPVLSQLENEKLTSALKRLKERDLYIFFAKAIEDRSFVEIAAELGIGYKAVTMSYSRMIAKIKKELSGGETNEF